VSYFVYEDLVDASETRIHDAQCHEVTGRKTGAETSRWHGPFETEAEARSTAERIAGTKRHPYRLAKCCLG
jgi:hypothetical protein